MKIAVAMSGGVDSSVAAALLQKQGYEIFGITMQQYDPEYGGYPRDEGIIADITDAKKVCESLSIPHYTIDVQTDFREIVVSNFISEYEQGRTPNPCTLCNPTIKFGKFLEEAFALGADKMATGHYLKLKENEGCYSIHQARDKDQSYMLWALTQKQLAKCLFPIADFSKDEVRKIAAKMNISVHEKKDSQEICFINGRYDDFLKNKINFDSGDIILPDGEVIGQHKGLPYYTVGQRKGLYTKKNYPLYVKKLDSKNNRLIVTDNLDDLFKDKVIIKNVNWISGEFPKSETKLMIKVRYNSPPVAVKKIEKKLEKVTINLKEKTRAITPGQSAVLYKGDELLGGGVIV